MLKPLAHRVQCECEPGYYDPALNHSFRYHLCLLYPIYYHPPAFIFFDLVCGLIACVDLYRVMFNPQHWGLFTEQN
jgi:hypothetical protein